MGWKHGQGIGPRVKRKRGQSNNFEQQVVGPSLPSEFQTVSAMTNYQIDFIVKQINTDWTQDLFTQLWFSTVSVFNDKRDRRIFASVNMNGFYAFK